MKLKKEKLEITDELEREAVEAVKRLASAAGLVDPPTPSPTHFAAILVRTNETIDRITSGKALSISWLARVAIPGVVAILFFFIGLHYYVPEKTGLHSITEAVKALSDDEIDSLTVRAATQDTELNYPSGLLEVSSDQLAEFFMSSESPAVVLETLSEQQQTEVASILESRFTNL